MYEVVIVFDRGGCVYVLSDVSEKSQVLGNLLEEMFDMGQWFERVGEMEPK